MLRRETGGYDYPLGVNDLRSPMARWFTVPRKENHKNRVEVSIRRLYSPRAALSAIVFRLSDGSGGGAVSTRFAYAVTTMLQL